MSVTDAKELSIIQGQIKKEASENCDNYVTLTSINSLFMQMKTKLSNIEPKTDSLKTRLAEIEKQMTLDTQSRSVAG